MWIEKQEMKERIAQIQKLYTDLVIDGGRTVVPAGTVTYLGLGPAETAALDELTGQLKLLG